MSTIAHTPSGKEINLTIVDGAVHATIPAAGISGKIDGPYKLPKPAQGCTHYANCGDKQIGLDSTNAAIISKLLADVRAAGLAAEKARLAEHVPGLDALRSAYNVEEGYDRAFTAMMEDEDNDGVRPPRKPATDAAALAAQYPRAALYLKADAYSCAAHDCKASAGRKAMDLLASGGTIEQAEHILANWLPASAQWD